MSIAEKPSGGDVVADHTTPNEARPALAGVKRVLTRFGLWLRLAVAVVLVALLVRLGAIDAASFFAVFTSPIAVGMALFLIVVALHIGIFRWDLLLRLQGVRIPFARLWHATFIGMFSGTFLPGGLAQDAVRIFYASNEPNCRVGTAVTSIMADRLLGLTGLLVAASIFIAVNVSHIANSTALRALAVATIGISVGAFVLFVGAVLLGNRKWLRQRLRALLERTGRVARAVNPVIKAARLYHGHIGGILACLALSVALHLCMAMAVIVLASTMDLGRIEWSELGLASLLSYLANALPLTPGGIGVGEAAFDQLCRLLGADNPSISYGSVFLAARSLSIAVSLLGAISLVANKRRPKSA